ncbi:hypothetical protein [Caballeronia sp. dw_19]|uniref:hypothetical protein n=1 Tax=Caballeronia sp. dw_19 TaxID=2719791 RepID=UPI001BD34F8B|nr:hypothetical protein [Caballeronia sp. dw_19]
MIKRACIAFSIFSWAIAHADPELTCLWIGSTYKAAAEQRDSGMNPQQAFDEDKSPDGSGLQNGVDDKTIKRIINQVYFDNDFADAGGTALSSQMYRACLRKQYKPLPVD